MGLENGVRKYIKVKVSKKVVRFQSPLAFVSMSVCVDNLTGKKYAFDKNMAFNLPSTD